MVSDVLAILNRHVADGPEAAALAVWRGAGELAAAAAEAAAVIADDTAREPRLRVAALLAAALLVQSGAPVPATALVALGDDVLVDAVLEAGASAAITGLAAAAGAAIGADDRRYLAQRLTAAGATGIHVAALVRAAGDPRAAAATAEAIASALREHGADSAAARAALHLAAAWAADDRPFAEAVAAGVPAPLCPGAAAAARAVGAGHHHPLVTALESRAA